MANNYDLIAPYYDRLSKLIFANTQHRAQIEQLKYIFSGSHILIAGGGTGWILEEIHKLQLNNIKITYLEVSAEMNQLASKKEIGTMHIQFVQSSAELFITSDQFDFILTGFLFDNFSEKTSNQVFKQFDEMLKPNGYWLFSDFQPSRSKQKWWHRLLLKVMYAFFKIVSGVHVKQVPEVFKLFKQSGYQELNSKSYFSGFIQAITYQKD